jgi:Divergent InlB B-repeat domain
MKIVLVGFMLALLLLFGPPEAGSSDFGKGKSPAEAGSGTLQKVIVKSGSATMDIDLNRLNGINSTTEKVETLRFAVAANSFFPILIFNNSLRGPTLGSMGLIPQNSGALPAALIASLNQLVIEKIDWSGDFDIVVRDGNSGFVFFNIEGNLYHYDARGQLLSIHGGRLLISKEFANALGRPSDTALVVGKISVEVTMQPIEIDQVLNGEPQSVAMPAVGTQPGPDVIVGDLSGLAQFDNAVGTKVGLALATVSCNNGQVDLDWFKLPDNHHPVIGQNLYRMSGGTDNTERFEQVGQASVKHAFFANSQDFCGFGCNGVNGTHLGSGCSDPYSASLNSGGTTHGLGSRAWINPFTGSFPRGDSQTPPNDHTGHVHTDVSHRIIVEVNDLNTTLNPGATYFAEAQYVTPHEYAWCQTNPGQCNQYNNASYRQFSVTGTNAPFSFSAVGSTAQTQPAIEAWAGATINQIEPDPGNDGIGLIGCKVTNPSAGVWHYEYAVYNQNLNRAIRSFSVPLGAGVNISNIGFHAPPQHPGWANDGTQNDAGYSSTPWTPTQTTNSLTWATQTLAQNQNANAIRWGTLYNFRFDADQPPQTATAAVGFFKTGSPISVGIQIPGPPPTVQVTVKTALAGLAFTVDGTSYSSTQTFSWASGSSHTIATTSPQSGGTGIRYVWTNWSGGGAISHTVAPTTNTTYTANFKTQYRLTMTHATGGTVSPASSWRNSGAAFSISATPTNNTQVSYSFAGWTGSGAGSYSGTNNPASITMNGPITENATFTQSNVQVTVQTKPAGRTFSVDGTSYTVVQTFSWQPGSTHTIATTSPQNGATGVRYVWVNWTGGGAISHTVAPTTNATYTANFNTQYRLTMTPGTGGTVSPTSSWRSSGAAISISATPATGYSFTNWTGSGTGSFSGTNNPASITIGGPITETATFTHN